MDAYLSIKCSMPSALEEELPTVLFDLPVLGTEITERGGDRVDVVVFLPADQSDRVAQATRLIIEAGGEGLEVEIVDHDDWMTNYREAVRPFAVGSSWWVDPHPETPTMAPPDRKRLVMPPRMAFGSGSHESTRLLLRALEAISPCDRSVLDVGTGSGILALAADALGARRVLAVDIDPVAVDIACQIRSLQEWRPRVQFVVGSVDCVAPGCFDLVLCNMISANFLPLLDAMTETLTPGGTLMISGLLVGEADTISGMLGRCGMETAPMTSLDGWASFRARRRT